MYDVFNYGFVTGLPACRKYPNDYGILTSKYRLTDIWRCATQSQPKTSDNELPYP